MFVRYSSCEWRTHIHVCTFTIFYSIHVQYLQKTGTDIGTRHQRNDVVLSTISFIIILNITYEVYFISIHSHFHCKFHILTFFFFFFFSFFSFSFSYSSYYYYHHHYYYTLVIKRVVLNRHVVRPSDCPSVHLSVQ